MKYHTYCPRCGAEFTAEHHSAGSLICACGWADTTTEVKAEASHQKRSIQIMTGFAFLFVAGLVHVGSWGNHAFSIPFTKAAELTGLLSTDGYRELAKTCVELNKWSCAEDAYLGAATAGFVEGYAQLGSLDARLNQPAKALQAYAAYEKSGGREQLPLIAFAKLLEGANQDAEATRVYEKSIQVKPEVLAVQATSGLVRIMIKQGHYTEAYERILAFHGSAENAGGYLNTEAAQLQKQLGETASKAIEKKAQKHVAQI